MPSMAERRANIMAAVPDMKNRNHNAFHGTVEDDVIASGEAALTSECRPSCGMMRNLRYIPRAKPTRIGHSHGGGKLHDGRAGRSQDSKLDLRHRDRGG